MRAKSSKKKLKLPSPETLLKQYTSALNHLLAVNAYIKAQWLRDRQRGKHYKLIALSGVKLDESVKQSIRDSAADLRYLQSLKLQIFSPLHSPKPCSARYISRPLHKRTPDEN